METQSYTAFKTTVGTEEIIGTHLHYLRMSRRWLSNSNTEFQNKLHQKVLRTGFLQENVKGVVICEFVNVVRLKNVKRRHMSDVSWNHLFPIDREQFSVAMAWAAFFQTFAITGWINSVKSRKYYIEPNLMVKGYGWKKIQINSTYKTGFISGVGLNLKLVHL